MLYVLTRLHHLFRNGELLGLELASVHNLVFYLWLMEQVRAHIQEGTFAGWYEGMARQVGRRI